MRKNLEQIISNGLKKFTANTPTEPMLLRKQLAEIRKTGYVITSGEMDEGALSVAAPIRDYTASVIGAISVVGPEFRMESKIQDHVKLCCMAAEKISRQMGYTTAEGRMMYNQELV